VIGWTVALLVLVWGSTWAAIRIGLEGIPPFGGVAARFGLAALVLSVVRRLARIPAAVPNRTLVRLWIVETIFGFLVAYGIVYWAEQWVPSGLTSVLFATFPLFVAVLARFWLEDDRLSGWRWLGIVLGFVGVAVIFSGDVAQLGGPRVLGASAVLLLSPLASAVAHVQVKRWGGGFHPFHLAVVPMGATGVLMGGVAVIVEGGGRWRLDAASIGSLLYLACVGSALTFTLYYWLLARVSATRLSLITYGIPVLAVLIGTVFLGEPFGRRAIGGSLLVLLGVGVATRGAGAGSRRIILTRGSK
jgi:drug/metabolite transporter (DMT)-like permease